MRTLKELVTNEKKVYVYLATKALRYRFMSDAEREGITYSDGKAATSREAEDYMALKADKTICFLGLVGHIALLNNAVPVVDYEKYIDGETGYLSYGRIKRK